MNSSEDEVQQDQLPHTPMRTARSTREADPSSDGTNDVTSLPSDKSIRDQLLAMQQQMLVLRNQLSMQRAQPQLPATNSHQSREYWQTPIDKTITYPGEDASTTSKLAYKQRLNSHLSKSPPIWRLISGEDPCPITLDITAMTLLKSVYGEKWNLEPKDIQSAMNFLQAKAPDVHKDVTEALDRGSDLMPGSWAQKNAALYGAISSTLDLSKNGKDLNILEVVQADNGLAMYNLLHERLREVKSSDPLARAIKLKLGLEHIKYVPVPHGVSKYFAAMAKHRTQLANMKPRPKIIDEWEVVAKALQDLPPLHSKFEDARSMLEFQRKFTKQDTSLKECRTIFINAEDDNEIWKDLGFKQPQQPKKRKLRTNLQQRQKRRAPDQDQQTYPKGSCVHHPFSTSHTSTMCTNPFGYSSAFTRATTHIDKCAAVRESIAAGWSPRATHVRIPKGFGSPQVSTPTTTDRPTGGVEPVLANVAHLRANNDTVNSVDIQSYHKVKALMAGVNPTPPAAQLPKPQPQQMTPTPSGAPTAVRAFHISHQYQQPRQRPYDPRAIYPQPVYQQPPPYFPGRPVFPTNPYHQHASMPVVRANVARLAQAGMPQPTDDDLIAAGMKYYSAQTGRQDFY